MNHRVSTAHRTSEAIGTVPLTPAAVETPLVQAPFITLAVELAMLAWCRMSPRMRVELTVLFLVSGMKK